MLIEGGYQAGAVLSFKLSTGEEIIAKFVSETDSVFVINKPMALIQSGQGLGLAPCLVSAKPTNNITLQKSLVVLHAPTQNNISDEYLRGTSGIKPVSTMPAGLIK